MRKRHYFFYEAGATTFVIPRNFVCAHVTAIDGTLTIVGQNGVQFFLADGETLPFWKIEMPYEEITITVPPLSTAKGWYIM